MGAMDVSYILLNSSSDSNGRYEEGMQFLHYLTIYPIAIATNKYSHSTLLS